jgi:hypothetical protein
MKTRRLIKKYKNKRNSKNRKSIKSRKIKNKSRSKSRSKSRKRILKGGVPPRGVIVKSSRNSRNSRNSRTSGKPIGVSKRSSISSRPSYITSDCCSDVAVVNRTKIIKNIQNINSLQLNFERFYSELISTPDNELSDKISSLKQRIIEATTIQPEGAYLSINGLKFLNYLRSKYIHAISQEEKNKIENIISLFDQHAMSQGVRYSDLEVIKTQLGSHDFDCYKNLYKEIYSKLFKFNDGDRYPVSVSAIPLYCKPRFKPTLKPIGE